MIRVYHFFVTLAMIAIYRTIWFSSEQWKGHDMERKRYCAALMAIEIMSLELQKLSTRTTVAAFLGSYIIDAESEEKAIKAALEVCQMKAPQDQGWFGHNVNVVLLDELLAELDGTP